MDGICQKCLRRKRQAAGKFYAGDQQVHRRASIRHATHSGDRSRPPLLVVVHDRSPQTPSAPRIASITLIA